MVRLWMYKKIIIKKLKIKNAANKQTGLNLTEYNPIEKQTNKHTNNEKKNKKSSNLAEDWEADEKKKRIIKKKQPIKVLIQQIIKLVMIKN